MNPRQDSPAQGLPRLRRAAPAYGENGAPGLAGHAGPLGARGDRHRGCLRQGPVTANMMPGSWMLA